MNDFTFAFLGVHDRDRPQRASVTRLAASFGVERGLVQHDREATVELERSHNSRAKPRQVGIGQVESLGHWIVSGAAWLNAVRFHLPLSNRACAFHAHGLTMVLRAWLAQDISRSLAAGAAQARSSGRAASRNTGSACAVLRAAAASG